MNKRKKNRAFALIELLVAVFVFCILFLIAMAFIKLAVGQTKSRHNQMLTSEIRTVMDTISQKMNNATEILRPSSPSTTIYGFKFQDNILGITAKDAAGNSSCTFIGIGQNGSSIGMNVSEGCTGGTGGAQWVIPADLNRPLTDSKNVKVTDFKVTGEMFDPLNLPDGASPYTPYVKIIIQAEDNDPKYADSNKITLQTMYMMDYQTIKKIEAEIK